MNLFIEGSGCLVTVQNIIMIILFFFIQPLFLVGLFYAVWNRRQRLAYVRETYRMNFNRSAFELTDYLFKGLLIALTLSVISIGLGVPLTIEWYIVYQVISVFVLLLTGSRFIHPLFTFSLSSLVLFLMQRFGQTLPLSRLANAINQESFIIDFQPDQFMNVLFNSLFFIVFFLLVTSFLMKDKDFNKLYPILRASQRGKTIAKYQNKFLWLLPVAILVPGRLIAPIAPWWPLLNIGSQDFGVLFLPVIIGLHFTVSTQSIQEALQYIKKDFQRLAGVAAILLVGSYFYRFLTIISLTLLLVGGFVIYYRHRQRENLWTFKYGPADEGLRVIAVRPESPADRMNLSIGTIITHINEEEMTSKEDFYEVITYNRSYIRMRLKRPDGEVIMVETPLYDDDANNLGLLIL